MYVDISVQHRGNKTYTRALLRESYREGGKVKHRTIANISKCSMEEIEAIQLALRHKDTLGNLGSIKNAIKLNQGKSAGAVIVLLDLARRKYRPVRCCRLVASRQLNLPSNVLSVLTTATRPAILRIFIVYSHEGESRARRRH